MQKKPRILSEERNFERFLYFEGSARKERGCFLGSMRFDRTRRDARRRRLSREGASSASLLVLVCPQAVFAVVRVRECRVRVEVSSS